MTTRTLTRRRLLETGAVATGAVLLGSTRATAAPPVKHVFSLIGEFSRYGAYLASMVDGSLPIDLAVSTFPDFSNRRLVGEQSPAADSIYRHDLAGMLTPGTQYYARLVARGTMFGRVIAFRTQVADASPMHLRIALVSCQRNAYNTDRLPLGWNRIKVFGPDLLLHGGDFGYWGGLLSAIDPYTTHIAKYARQLTGVHAMRDVLEAVCSLIQVSDHELSPNGGDTFNDPITATALEAYFRLMPYRTFDDVTQRSRFLTRRLGTNVRLVAPDFRSLDRSPGAWVDHASKTAWGAVQFALFRAAMKQPEALKIILSDPGASPANTPADPSDPRLIDKWCNYQSAYQAFSDVIRNELTVNGKPIRADVWSGDRHVIGCLGEANNPWGPFDVLTSSGIDEEANALEDGELYDQVYGYKTGRGINVVKQHMEIDLFDDKVGTITRTASGIDDITGRVVVTSKKRWSYKVAA
ncbi:MAG: hypothetical protein ACR2HA_11110 [Nocardioides sp.]